MELPINLKEYIPNEITIIPNTLIPTALAESPPDKKSACISIVSEILDKMGQASARAQKLLTPVTSAIKFSHSEQIIYLIADTTDLNMINRVIGYLKMGCKDLFVFHPNGLYKKRRCFCCLDFYIHESKQRQGFGKKLFDFMLNHNGISASSIPIDRPSEKLLKFLQKHYGLSTIIPQSNNFILYEPFFKDDNTDTDELNSHRESFYNSKSHAMKNRIQQQWRDKTVDINR